MPIPSSQESVRTKQPAELPELPIFYSPAYTMSAYNFDTTRKATWVATSLQQRPISGVVLIEPSSLTQGMILTVHDPEYVEAVRRGEPRQLAESSGLDWDEHVWDAVCASNGGAVAAAKKAYQSRLHAGSLSSGLHHASAARGKGFCTFNGLALAAREVLAAGARSVLILDLDAHCGGGTYGIVRTWPAVVHLDISVSLVDHYQVDAATPSTLDHVTNAAKYLPTLCERLSDLSDTEIDVVIYNAGVDPHQHCDIGGLAGITNAILAERERMVFEWARARLAPVAFVLAGGYAGGSLQQDTLVELHRLTVAAAASSRPLARPGV
jgi:acetoin utilization deacetylase AcuC-like enzyme